MPYYLPSLYLSDINCKIMRLNISYKLNETMTYLAFFTLELKCNKLHLNQ